MIGVKDENSRIFVALKNRTSSSLCISLEDSKKSVLVDLITSIVDLNRIVYIVTCRTVKDHALEWVFLVVSNIVVDHVNNVVITNAVLH